MQTVDNLDLTTCFCPVLLQTIMAWDMVHSAVQISIHSCIATSYTAKRWHSGRTREISRASDKGEQLTLFLAAHCWGQIVCLHQQEHKGARAPADQWQPLLDSAQQILAGKWPHLSSLRRQQMSTAHPQLTRQPGEQQAELLKHRDKEKGKSLASASDQQVLVTLTDRITHKAVGKDRSTSFSW